MKGFKNYVQVLCITILSVSILLVSACGGGGSDEKEPGTTEPETTEPGTTEPETTGTKTLSLGDQLEVEVGSKTVSINYANDLSTVTFPKGESDSATATIDNKFFISETEVTNAVFKEVLQWAYDNGKFSTEIGSENEVTESFAKHKGFTLIDLTGSIMKPIGVEHNVRIAFDASSESFSVESGYEDHPVLFVSWYGAIMFCNWLTEMRDGHTDNVVYSIDLLHDVTNEDISKNGFRLPSSEEWEYAARYRGADTTNTVTDTVDDIDFNAMEIKWTKGNSASGAVNNSDDETATRTVAWFDNDTDMGTNGQLMPVAEKVANTIGIYDMSGNASEWCSSGDNSNRVTRGGDWMSNNPVALNIGSLNQAPPSSCNPNTGFRFARTE